MQRQPYLERLRIGLALIRIGREQVGMHLLDDGADELAGLAGERHVVAADDAFCASSASKRKDPAEGGRPLGAGCWCALRCEGLQRPTTLWTQHPTQVGQENSGFCRPLASRVVRSALA